MPYDKDSGHPNSWEPLRDFDPYHTMLRVNLEIEKAEPKYKPLHICEVGCGCQTVQNLWFEPFNFGDELRFELMMYCPNCQTSYKTDADRQTVDYYNELYDVALREMKILGTEEMKKFAGAFLFAIRHADIWPDDFNI